MVDFSKVTTFQESLIDVGVPGADISIYLKGKEVYRHQVGQVGPFTLYEIWSMTKIITCVAALRLYEQGLFLLSDPLHDYLPAFKKMMYRKNQTDGTVDIVPCKNPIRIIVRTPNPYPYPA